MTGSVFVRIGHRLGYAARALGVGFVLLAWMLVAPLVRVLTCRRRRARGLRPVGETIAPPTAPGPSSQAPSPQPPRGFSDRFAFPEIDVVEVEPEFGERLYATVFGLLQLGPRAKLLDLRAAQTVKVELFERLASAWHVPRGAVPRLGILLGYESWVVLRNVAARRLRPLADSGVEIAIFYAQQADSVPAWFAGGRVSHDRLHDVIDWLRTQWRPTAIWPTVLSTTATLVQGSAEVAAVPEMLLELSAIARSFEGAEGAEQAIKYARAALSWVGDQPSRARCRALRVLAAATLGRGQTEPALALLETAITHAAVIKDRIEEASALAEIGFLALRSGHAARAEDRFRRAIALLTADDLPYLQATLHHHLALALHEQRKDDEAEGQVAAALTLRWDPGSRLAEADRALLALIRARRASQSSERPRNEHRHPRET